MIFDPETRHISFACEDDEDEEEVVDPRQHYLELVDDARDVMRRVMRTPNENFPDFLWEPSHNEFNNELAENPKRYIEMGTGKIEVINAGEIIRSIRGLKNKYKDYFDYIDALDVWNRYCYWIETEFGDFEFFKELVKSGSTAVPYKRKPKLANKAGNKYLKNITVPISRINREEGLSDEAFAEICRNLPDQLEVYEDYYEYITLLEDFNKKEEVRMQRENRIRNYRKTTSIGTPEADAVMRYLSGDRNVDNYGQSAFNRPLTEEIEYFHEYDGYDEELKKDLMGLRQSAYIDPNTGIWMQTNREKDSIDVFSEMAKNGWDVGAAMESSDMSKSAKKMIRRNAGFSEEEMSPKKAKKLRKKRRKNNQKLYESLSANEGVRDLLTKNRVSFDPDENMISFTLSDIMPK